MSERPANYAAVAWGNDPRKMSEVDLLPCPNCSHRAGKATKRAAKGFPFVGLWKVSCQRPDCPLAMIYFHPVEWNRLPRISQSEYDALQAECEKLRKDAELYRRLRGLSHGQLGAPGIPCVAVPEAHNKGRYVSGEDLDAAMQGGDA